MRVSRLAGMHQVGRPWKLSWYRQGLDQARFVESTS